jgi:CHRD domain
MSRPVYHKVQDMNARKVLLLATLLLSGCMDYMSDPANSKARLWATLSGANEISPSGSHAQGWMKASYSPGTQILQWRLAFRDLSGPVTWAYFHGPDGVGNDDAAIVPINLQIEGYLHPGAATLTPQQADDLMAGRWYVNIRTERFPDGELRGQVVPAR